MGDKADLLAKNLLLLNGNSLGRAGAYSVSPWGNPYGGTIVPGTYGDGSKFPGGLSGSGTFLNLDHNALRINARRAFHDSPQAKSIVQRSTDVVVDIGIKIEPTPAASILGISSEEADIWASDVKTRFNMWFGSKDVHAAGLMTGFQLQRLYQTCQLRDGEVFIRCYYLPKSPNPLKIEIIDPVQICGDGLTSTSGLRFLQDGIKRDEFGAETSYRVMVEDSKNPGTYTAVEVPARSKDGKRPFMLHGFCQEYPGQGRGYSGLGHALQEFQQITDFSTAIIAKAIQQASIALMVKPSADRAASNPYEDIGSLVPAGPITVNPSTATVQQTSFASVDYTPIPEASLTSPSVGVFNLKGGEELKPFQNTAPGDSFHTFVDAFTAYLAASMSMPIEVLLMRFNSNYSASRAALLMFWRVAEIHRKDMDGDFLTPIFEAWLAEEIAARRIRAPGWQDPILKSAWLMHDVVGVPVPNIDPAKLAVGHKAQIEMGATTLSRVAHDTNGSDGAANRAKLARELLDLPVPPWSKGSASTSLKRKSDDNEDEQEDED